MRGLEKVAERLEGLVEDGQAATAASLYELFLAGAYEKAEEIDDSGGSLGMFVTDLFCGWARARQVSAADPQETIDLLLGWMDGDDYGFLSILSTLLSALHCCLLPCMADAGDWHGFERHLRAAEKLMEKTGIIDDAMAGVARLAAKQATEAGRNGLASRCYEVAGRIYVAPRRKRDAAIVQVAKRPLGT